MELLEPELDATSVVDLIARACVDHHDVVAASGVGDTLTYAQLWTRSVDLAHELAARGVVPEDRVGLWGAQSSDLLVGIVGIWLAGGAYVPLDPSFPSSRLEFVVADARLTIVVAPDRLHATASRLGPAVVSSSPRVGGPRAVASLPAVRGDNAAYVIYTSGSTGRPKGVVVEHHSVVDLFTAMRTAVDVSPGDGFMGTASPAFDASIPYLLFPLVVGGTVLAIDDETAQDPYLLAAQLSRTHPRVVLTLPGMLRLLVETKWKGDLDLEVWTGGERTPPDVIRYLVPRVRALHNWYGPTEATVQVAVARLGAHDVDSPIGSPLDHVDVFVLDEHGVSVARGEVGELFVTGSALARGYLNDPALTAERFTSIRVASAPPVRAYRTGDLARVRDDGALVILGRLDDQLNVRGYRIEPQEIEAHLCEFPGVIESVVVTSGASDGDDQRLAAFVTTDTTIDVTALRASVRDTLPAHMVPATIQVLASLPRTSSGKLDRRGVAELAGRGDGALPTDDVAEPSRAATPLEHEVIELFAGVLSLSASSIGLDQDFFDLGGTSLKGVRLFLALEDRLGTHLPLSTLASSSTPRRLAESIADEWTSRSRSGTPRDAPRHEWERILNGIWRDTLGVKELARTDSFFELGGSRDGAARMLEEVRSHYGVEVTADEFAASPTIMDLALLIGRRSVRSVLVPLTVTGEGPPLFLIAGAGGLAITFLPIARLLGPEQPCYGLQAQGIESRAVPDVTLHAAARRFAKAIREVQPHGPYLLGGHSLGGVHALQVAQLLHHEGDEVALLAIFDTPLSRSMVGRRAAKASLSGNTSVAAPRRGLPKLATVLHLPIVGVVPLRGTAQFEAFAALGELQAMFSRRLRPWAGPSTLFLSNEDETPVIEARWGSVLTGSWTSAKVPGGHIAMLDRSNVAVAATILRDQIDRVLDRGAGRERSVAPR